MCLDAQPHRRLSALHAAPGTRAQLLPHACSRSRVGAEANPLDPFRDSRHALKQLLPHASSHALVYAQVCCTTHASAFGGRIRTACKLSGWSACRACTLLVHYVHSRVPGIHGRLTQQHKAGFPSLGRTFSVHRPPHAPHPLPTTCASSIAHHMRLIHRPPHAPHPYLNMAKLLLSQ